MSVPVPTPEVHSAIDACGIFAQNLLDEAHGLEKRAPLIRIEEADGRDRVGDGDLICSLRLLLVVSGLIKADVVLDKSSLEPHIDGVCSVVLALEPL